MKDIRKQGAPEQITPEAIRAARQAVGMTQTEAAALIYSTLRTWQDWEAGKAQMHYGLWELFVIKAGKLS